MTTIDNLMALADEYAGRSQLTEQGETLSREALRTALTEALAFQPDWADFNNGRECGRIEATEALGKDGSLIDEGTKSQPSVKESFTVAEHSAELDAGMAAQQYCRGLWGAARGHSEWRKVHEHFANGYKQGRYDEAMAQGPNPWPESIEDFEIRGKLAADLQCWHRLTGAEAENLVSFFANHIRTAGNAPDCWVVVKDGRILGTHDEPGHIDGLHAIRYVPAQAVQPVREPANWYCIDKSGMATLCADEDDALQNAKLAALDWPNNAPYRAVQLVEAQPVREPLQDALAWELWLNAVDTANNTGRLVAYTYKEAIERAHNIRGEK